jgi:hypothetical protein
MVIGGHIESVRLIHFMTPSGERTCTHIPACY